MISIILIALSAVCNAVMDITSHKFYESIFSKYNHQYWNPAISWENKYDSLLLTRKKFMGVNIHPAFTDGWHLMKSSMVVLICLAVVLYKPIFGKAILVDIMALGTAWNITFSWFYNRILKKRY